jgi:hypothetical protein
MEGTEAVRVGVRTGVLSKGETAAGVPAVVLAEVVMPASREVEAAVAVAVDVDVDVVLCVSVLVLVLGPAPGPEPAAAAGGVGPLPLEAGWGGDVNALAAPVLEGVTSGGFGVWPEELNCNKNKNTFSTQLHKIKIYNTNKIIL